MTILRNTEEWHSCKLVHLTMVGEHFQIYAKNAFASLKIYSTQLHISTLAKFSPGFLSSSPAQSEIIHSLMASSFKKLFTSAERGEKL